MTKRSFMRAVALSFSLVFFSAPLLADTVTLKDGSVREGRISSHDENGVTMEVVFGTLRGQVRIPKSEIASIVKGPLPDTPGHTEAEKLRKAALEKEGQAAADEWVKLGDYYASREGFSSKAKESYQQALKSDPEHAAAHGRLGHLKTENGWLPLAEESRKRGLVPLDDAWVKPEERAWLIDRRDEQENDDLRIGARKDEPFRRQDVEEQLRLKRAEEEWAKREKLRLSHGESLLSRYGYFLPPGGGYFIGSNGETPYHLDGVGIQSGDSSFFVGRVGTGYHPLYCADPYYPYRCSTRSYPYYTYGYSPGVVYRGGNYTLGFGTSFGSSYRGYSQAYDGGYGCYGGFGFSISGGSKNFKYNFNYGGSSSRSSSSGFSRYSF